MTIFVLGVASNHLEKNRNSFIVQKRIQGVGYTIAEHKQKVLKENMKKETYC